MEKDFKSKKEKIQSRRLKEREQRRKEIIDAAERLTIIHGLKIITMEKVAEEATLSKGTLYYYFENKEDLILAVASRGFQELTRRYKQKIEGKNSLTEMLKGLLRAYYDLIVENPGFRDILPRTQSVIFRTPIEIKLKLMESTDKPSQFNRGESIPVLTRNEKDFMKAFHENSEVLIKIIKSAIEDKKLSLSLNPELLATYISFLTRDILEELSLRQNLLQRYDTSEEEAFDTLIDLLATGFLKR